MELLDLLYSTPTMIEAMQHKPPRSSFLRDRYFPTDDRKDIFNTPKVIVDIKQGSSKMAPVVMPRINGITVERDSFRTEEMEPPFVAPKRTLTVDDMQKRGFGEALYSDSTPENREASYLATDLEDLEELHRNREEFIAAECMKNNGYVLTQYANELGEKGEEYEIHFYQEASNPAVYASAVKWDQPGANVFGDLTAMVREAKKFVNVTDLVASPDVIDAIISDEKIAKMFDNRNMNFGDFEPTQVDNMVSVYGRINIDGRLITLYGYSGEFTDDLTGQDAPLFSAGEMVLAAPATGHAMYGCITQMEMLDKKFHTYAGKRVPKYYVDVDGDIRTIRIASKPLFAPQSINPFWYAKVL